MARKISRLFLVERLCWAVTGCDFVKAIPAYVRDVQLDPSRKGQLWIPLYRRLEGAAPVKAFLDEGKAEACCRRMEEEAWARINPFRHGDRPEQWTTFDAGRLRDWLLDAGLEPPAGKLNVKAWRGWYDRARDGLTELQRLRLREALDRVRFYQVSELTE
jgi:hypothetical protein